MKPMLRALLAELAEDKFRADEGIAENVVGSVADGLEHASSVVDPQHKDGKHDLQAKPQATVLPRIARRLVEKM